MLSRPLRQRRMTSCRFYGSGSQLYRRMPTPVEKAYPYLAAYILCHRSDDTGLTSEVGPWR